ncbi:sensor histidine kinase [Roseburia sp. 499]|uniref:sensor histidine kinase n=1 Tax=Roseburia sp. 499 TaxID=1261634 RepID=UPI000953592A|nr:sensor histidine kinase [Roseburia sp. 499]WVK69758.1 sensor histidine kinase [Roseburia sp. 499]
MIIEYLEKIYAEMYEQKVSLERDYKKNELLLKENIQFIYTLENSLDRNYESFSPRDINHESYEKIENLKEEKSQIEKQEEILRIKISDLNDHLAELEHVLKVVRENTKAIEEKEVLLEDDEFFRKKILETQEMERQRIARELHDSIVQNLTSIVHKIEFCTKLMDMDTVRCKLELQTMSKMVKRIIEDMRQVIYDLRPMSLDDIGLDVTLEREAAKWRNTGKVLVDYQTEGIIKKLPPLTSLTVLRIVQEACNNTIKHSGAKNIKIILSYEKEKVKVEIADDGCGFEVESIEHLQRDDGSGFGISIMKERVYLLSGKINIESIIGEGTKISVEFPIDKEEN